MNKTAIYVTPTKKFLDRLQQGGPSDSASVEPTVGKNKKLYVVHHSEAEAKPERVLPAVCSKIASVEFSSRQVQSDHCPQISCVEDFEQYFDWEPAE